jgi:hypothetical protein
MVVWDAAYLFSLASFVRDVALLLPVSDSIAEQILIDACAIACQVSVPLAPLTPLMVLFGAMFPPVCKVVEAGVKHGPWDIWGYQGIVEDVWLKAAKGIGVGQGV